MTCEQPPQRHSDIEDSMRTVAGVGRVNVAEVAWGTRANIDHEKDVSARGVTEEAQKKRMGAT